MNTVSSRNFLLIFFQTSALGQGFDNFYALIGGFQTQDRRYLEYVDGSSMFDGLFYDADGQVKILPFFFCSFLFIFFLSYYPPSCPLPATSLVGG